jgi:hypothetical protein
MAPVADAERRGREVLVEDGLSGHTAQFARALLSQSETPGHLMGAQFIGFDDTRLITAPA